MKILHTSDWHLGMPLQMGTLLDDQRDFFAQLYKIIEAENVDVVLVAGDIYDTSVTNVDSIRLYNEVVTKICMEMHKKMVIIAGNHDSGPRLATCHALLEAAGLYVRGKLTKEISPISFGDVDVYPIPFFNRDEVIALFPEEKESIRSQEDATKLVCDHIRAKMNPKKFNIAVAHAYIVNAELSDSDRAAQVGFASAVSKAVFDGFDYVALGHIHKPQIVSDTVRYSGSPLAYSFGKEETQQKQVVLLDTEKNTQTEIYIQPQHARVSLTGTYAEIQDAQGHDNDYMKITVTDRVAGLALLTELREKFPYLLELYGKAFTATGEASSISLEQMQNMDEMTIMQQFLKEEYDFTPTEEQKALFQDVVQKLQEGSEIE